MLDGNRSFVDPTEVLDLVYDETNKKVDIGNQRDIIEYLMIFFEHVEVGLKICTEDDVNKVRTESSITKSNLKLKAMDIFKGKLVAEIVDSNRSVNQGALVEEDFGPILVDVRYSDLVEALHQKFQYPIKLNTHEVN